MARQKSGVAEYRNYYLPYDFPVLLLSGEHWKISSVPSKNLHFHNCLEIGVCHSDSGYMEFIGKKDPLLFREGDVTCIPRNIPHTTYSSPGTESHWSYLFIDPAELFRNISPNFGRDFDLSLPAFKNYKHILSRDEYPQVYQLTMAVIKEGGKRNGRKETPLSDKCDRITSCIVYRAVPNPERRWFQYSSYQPAT